MGILIFGLIIGVITIGAILLDSFRTQHKGMEGQAKFWPKVINRIVEKDK